jgi:regulation of enolase protein 1 (concanavalin A-like superfamily)
VFGAASADGAGWTSVKPIAVELPKAVQVGVVAGHNTSSPFEPAFDEFQLFAEVGAGRARPPGGK